MWLNSSEYGNRRVSSARLPYTPRTGIRDVERIVSLAFESITSRRPIIAVKDDVLVNGARSKDRIGQDRRSFFHSRNYHPEASAYTLETIARSTDRLPNAIPRASFNFLSFCVKWVMRAEQSHGTRASTLHSRLARKEFGGEETRRRDASRG